LTGLIGLIFPLTIKAQSINRHSILVTEIFPDPTPSIGLPASEFIELTNVSDTAINLLNWKIGDGSSTTRISIPFLLKPDSIVIICSSTSISNWQPFGSTIGVTSFPSLNNDADMVILYSPDNRIIHAISYEISWYKNEVKSQGGWTLEMIDLKNPCGEGQNWTASKDAKGGTPGQINSVNASNPDQTSPELLRTYLLDSVSLIAILNEPIDSSVASNTLSFQFSPKLDIISANAVSPLFNSILIKLKQKPDSNQVYELTIKSITDCAGNSIGNFNKRKFGVPRSLKKNDLVINEILFNPKTDGYDYVEFYNSGSKIADLSKVFVAGRNINGDLISINKITNEPFLFFPGEWITITENRTWVMNNYNVKQPEFLINISDLPSLPDDKGTIVLLNSEGVIIDELRYDDNWHFALVSNKDGVALERIDYSNPTQDKNNWTSAASTAGFGTPTAMNSQFLNDPQLQGAITISPKIFSPDNDGFDDRAILSYQLDEPGYVMNTTIFDISGRVVRRLVQNATLSQQGNFYWDGLDDKQQRLAIGVYVVYTEVFNLKGKKGKY